MISEKAGKFINDFAIAVVNNSRTLSAEYIEQEEAAEKALVDYIADLETRVERAEKMVERLIEAGEKIKSHASIIKSGRAGYDCENWRKLVAGWKSPANGEVKND